MPFYYLPCRSIFWIIIVQMSDPDFSLYLKSFKTEYFIEGIMVVIQNIDEGYFGTFQNWFFLIDLQAEGFNGRCNWNSQSCDYYVQFGVKMCDTIDTIQSIFWSKAAFSSLSQLHPWSKNVVCVHDCVSVRVNVRQTLTSSRDMKEMKYDLIGRNTFFDIIKYLRSLLKRAYPIGLTAELR